MASESALELTHTVRKFLDEFLDGALGNIDHFLAHRACFPAKFRFKRFSLAFCHYMVQYIAAPSER